MLISSRQSVVESCDRADLGGRGFAHLESHTGSVAGFRQGTVLGGATIYGFHSRKTHFYGGTVEGLTWGRV